MPRVTIDKCDRCGTVRKEEEVWWVSSKGRSSIIIGTFTSDMVPQFNDRMLCGEQCAVTELNEFLQDQKAGRKARQIENVIEPHVPIVNGPSTSDQTGRLGTTSSSSTGNPPTTRCSSLAPWVGK